MTTEAACGLAASVRCRVQSLAALRADQETLAGLRRNPESFPGLTIPPTLLKYADDQTVAALIAVLRAVAHTGVGPEQYNGWGVLAASSFFGRAFSAHALQRFIREGAWGITPHMVPHHSLHAISGTISQAFNIQGPNFGIGGGPQAHAEGLLGAASYLADNDCPGLWLVLTGHDPEQVPEEAEEAKNSPCECLAVALALTPTPALGPGPHIVLTPGAQTDSRLPPFRLADFVAVLGATPRPTSRQWSLPWGGSLRWQERPTFSREPSASAASALATVPC